MKLKPAVLLSFLAIPAALALSGCGGGDSAAPTETPPAEATAEEAPAPEETAEPVTDVEVIIKTDKGDMPATIYATKTPITAANFLNLAKRGYYEGVVFHRVEPGFVIQGGDPTGTGRGGPGYTIPLEVVDGLLHAEAGILSMARKPQPDTAGSQFFVTLDETPHLDGGYAVFGKVTSNVAIAQNIAIGDKILGVEILGNPAPLFAQEAELIAEWNAELDQNFPAK